ncbi:MAG: Gfo/Idh/MocA family oxidoreductase [Pyrinomonadaceae bacterium]
MKEKIGIGVIGTGFARRVQIPAFQKVEKAEIVSIASRHRENARRTAEEFGVGHFTDDWRETLERGDVDLVCITTPPDTHHEMTLRALELGKHILCEKPMAMNASQAREMTEKAAEKRVLALIDHELRFQDGRQKAFEILRSGEIGKIRHAKYDFRNSSRGSSDLPWGWWSTLEHGGGTLGAIGSHIIDSFNWFLGTEMAEVFCQLQTHVKERKDEKTGETRAVTSDDECNLIVRFNDGDLTEDATGRISASMVEYPDYRNVVEFFGSEGSIRVDFRGELQIARKGEKNWTPIEVDLGENIPGVGDTGFSRGFTAFAPRIIEALLKGETGIEHAATFADGLKVQKVLDAARESNASGCTVRL